MRETLDGRGKSGRTSNGFRFRHRLNIVDIVVVQNGQWLVLALGHFQ